MAFSTNVFAAVFVAIVLATSGTSQTSTTTEEPDQPRCNLIDCEYLQRYMNQGLSPILARYYKTIRPPFKPWDDYWRFVVGTCDASTSCSDCLNSGNQTTEFLCYESSISQGCDIDPKIEEKMRGKDVIFFLHNGNKLIDKTYLAGPCSVPQWNHLLDVCNVDCKIAQFCGCATPATPAPQDDQMPAWETALIVIGSFCGFGLLAASFGYYYVKHRKRHTAAVPPIASSEGERLLYAEPPSLPQPETSAATESSVRYIL